MHTNTEIKTPTFADRLFNPIKTIRSNEKLIKKIAIVALSILIGIFTLFIPHLVHYWYSRSVRPIKKEEIHFKVPPRMMVKKTEKLAAKQIPNVFADFALQPNYGVGAKVLGHIAGQRVIGGTSLEGASHREILSHTLEFLKKSKLLFSKKETLIKKIGLAQTLANLKNKDEFQQVIHEAVKNFLSEKESILIPFGWRGSPGHAMYLEVHYVSSTDCTIRLFNLGNGGENHLHLGHKMLPFLDWTGVEIKKFTSGPFLQAIFEMNNTSLSSSHKEYSAKDIYISCKSLLTPKEEKKNFTENEFSFDKWMAPQEIGICCWKSLAAFLSTYLTKQEYKLLVADMKIDAIDKFAKDNHSTQNENSTYLLEKSIQAVSNYIKKQVTKSQIPNTYIAIALEHFERAKKLWTEGQSRLIKGDSRQSDKLIYRPLTQTAKLNNTASSSIGSSSFNSIRARSIEILEEIRQLAKPPLKKEDSRFGDLVFLLEKDKNLWKEESLAIHQGLLEFLHNIPSDQQIWKNCISPKHAETILSQTSKIAEIAFASWYGIPTCWAIQPEQIQIFMQLIQIQNHLTRIVYKLNVNEVCMDYKTFEVFKEKCVQGITFKFFNYAYSPDFKTYFFKALDFSVDNKELADSNFWEILKNHYPEFIKTLETQFPQISQSELVLKAVTAKDLPSPLKALLNTKIFFRNMLLSKSIPEENVRQASTSAHFEPVLTYKYEKQSGVIEYTILSTKYEEDQHRLSKLYGDAQDLAFSRLKQAYLNHSSDSDETVTRPRLFPEKELKKWSQKEICSLLRIFHAQETVHNDLLVYCSNENLQAIFETDFQRLFIPLLLKSKPGIQLINLRKWLKDTLKNLIRSRSDELNTLCFLLRSIRYTYWMTPNDKISDEHFKQIERVKIRAKETPVLRLAYLEELISWSRKISLQDEELMFLAKDLCILNHHPLTTNDIDPVWLFELGKANLHLAKKLTCFFERDPDRINPVLKSLDPNQRERTWTKSEEGKFVSNEGDIFYAHTCLFELKKIDSKKTFLPPIILERRSFQNLFPQITEGHLVRTDTSGYYEFEDPTTNRLTKVNYNGDISQFIENEWWRLEENLFIEDKNSGEKKFVLGSGALTFRCRTFCNEQRVFRCEDPRTHKVLYRATPQKDRTLILQDQETNLLLSSPSPLFQTMTHPTAIEEWYNDQNELVWTSLPTLGLRFTKRNHKLFCEELPEFYLDLSKARQVVIHNCPFGIILENGKGQRKFLLPEIEEILSCKKAESLIPHFRAEFSLKTPPLGTEKYYVYDLSLDGRLTTKNGIHDIYLASIYALFHEYEKAFDILKKQRGQLLPFNENPLLQRSLRNIIEFRQTIGDQTPQATALTTFTYFLILKNALNYPKIKKSFFTEEDHEDLSILYSQFLRKKHHVPFISLEKEEECFLIEYLDPKGENTFFQERKKILEGKERNPLLSPIQSIQKKDKNTPLSWKGDFTLSLSPSPKKDICEQNLITRPKLNENLDSYYQIALKGSTEQKQWLEAALIFAEQDSAEKKSVFFLRLVLKFSNKFILLPLELAPIRNLVKELIDTQQEQTKISIPEVIPELHTQPPFAFFVPFEPLEPIEGILPFEISQEEIDLADLIKDQVQSTVEPKKIPQKLREFLAQGLNTPSPIQKMEYQRLEEDLKEYEKGRVIVHAITNKEKFLKALQDKGEAKQLEDLEAKILAIANELPKDNQKIQFLKLQGHVRTFTLDSLLINFARQKPALLQKNNPSLSRKAITEIYELCGQYLILATYRHQKERVKKTFSKNLEEEAASLAMTKRAYKIDPKNPKSLAYLVFEYYSDLLLRPEQVALQERFLDHLDQCYAQEMIMGSGKSKVISVLLALLRADGKNISTIVVGTPFYKDVALHTNEILQKTFEQTLTTIHFDRGTPLTISSLQSLISTLESVRDNQNSLIITSKTFQCLVLRFVEEWIHFSESSNQELPRELLLLGNILNLIRRQGNLLIDELDTVLNVLHTVSFSIGKKEKLKSCLLKINRSIYEILYNDPEIKSLGRIESDPHADLKADFLTKESYQKNVRALLAKKFLAQLSSVKFEKPIEQQAAKEIQASPQEPLIDFICQDPLLTKEKVGVANAAYHLLSLCAKDLISQAALEIGHLLENTLTKTSNEKYGIPKGDLFAIPYSAANTPCKGSEFASPIVTYNYTLQSISKYPIKRAVIQRLITEVIKRIQTDVENTEGGLEDLIHTWEQKLGVVFSQTKTSWKAISDKINSHFSFKQDFLEDFVFAKMEFYSEKMTSHSQNIAEASTLMKGFTGTLWNATTFHQKFIASPEKGTDSKSLALLFSHSDEPIMEYEKMDSNWDMFIDAGGYYKNYENIKIARKIALDRKTNVVFYHDRIQTVTDGVKETPFKALTLKEGEYITFLDQANTTGADVIQKYSAKGYVTIKAAMLKRDLLQAAWRLRGLAKGQTIRWVVDKATSSLIRSTLKLKESDPIGFSEILSYTIHNESEQIAMDNYQACTQQIENEKQQLLIQTLLGDSTVGEKRKILEALKSTWSKSETVSHPSQHFSSVPQMIHTMLYLDARQKEATDQINGLSLSVETKKKAIEAIGTIIKRYATPGMLLETIKSPQATADESVEVEQEAEQEMEVEAEVVQEVEREVVELEEYRAYDSLKITTTSIEANGTIPILDACNRLRFEDYFLKHPRFQTLGIEKAFHGIHVSLNFLEKNVLHPQKIENYHLHHTYQKEFDYLVFNKDFTTLITQNEAATYLNKYRIFSLKSGKFLNKDETLFTSNESTHLLKICFLAGVSHYNEKDLDRLEKWIKEFPKLIPFFKEIFPKNDRLRDLKFKNSPLAKLFVKLSKEPF